MITTKQAYSPVCTYLGNAVRLECQCNKPSIENKSYCEEHVWTVYQKNSMLGRRVKDTRVANSVHLWESLFNEAVEELIAEGEIV
jgi:hypothetical protein